MSLLLFAAFDKAGVTTAASIQSPSSMSVKCASSGIEGKLLECLLCCESVYLLLNKLPHIGEPLRQAIHTCSSPPCKIQRLHTLLQLTPSQRAGHTYGPLPLFHKGSHCPEEAACIKQSRPATTPSNPRGKHCEESHGEELLISVRVSPDVTEDKLRVSEDLVTYMRSESRHPLNTRMYT